MAIPAEVQDRVEDRLRRFCRERVPARLSGRVNLTHGIEGTRVTLVERRPQFLGEGMWTETEVAQFRYRPSDGTWALYWMDRHHEWNEYRDVDATGSFEELLREVDRDPTGIFWG
jgi:hypothetical protein